VNLLNTRSNSDDVIGMSITLSNKFWVKMAQGRAQEQGRIREREKRTTARNLLSNQLPGRAAGLAASTSVAPSASGPRASSLVPTPVPATRSLSSSTFSHTLASRTARTPHAFTRRHAPETGLPPAKGPYTRTTTTDGS